MILYCAMFSVRNIGINSPAYHQSQQHFRTFHIQTLGFGCFNNPGPHIDTLLQGRISKITVSYNLWLSLVLIFLVCSNQQEIKGIIIFEWVTGPNPQEKTECCQIIRTWRKVCRPSCGCLFTPF